MELSMDQRQKKQRSLVIPHSQLQQAFVKVLFCASVKYLNPPFQQCFKGDILKTLDNVIGTWGRLSCIFLRCLHLEVFDRTKYLQNVRIYTVLHVYSIIFVIMLVRHIRSLNPQSSSERTYVFVNPVTSALVVRFFFRIRDHLRVDLVRVRFQIE